MARAKKSKPTPLPTTADKIVGHEAPRAFLDAVVKRKRVAHAYLFVGPEEIGKRTVATHFARKLLRAAPGTEYQDPHFFFVTREEGKQSIAIEQIRELQGALALKPVETRPRIVLIDGADRMSEEGMNAMLKTLEEPPIGTIFLLVTATPAALLSTIRSRCHAVRFGPVPEDVVRGHLESIGWAPEKAALAARLTGGRIGRALAGAEEMDLAREKLEETLGHILQHNVNAVVESLTKIRDPQKSRREAVFVFDLLLLAMREAFRAKIDGRKADTALVPENLVNALADRSNDEVLERIDLLLEHRHLLDLNANVGLTVENALLRI